MNFKKYILPLFILFSICVFSQEKMIYQEDVEFNVNITVVDENDRGILKNVEITVGAKSYSSPNIKGVYVIRAKVNDQIAVSHPDFDTVYYTLKSNEDVKVLVEDYFLEEKKVYSKFKSISKRNDLYLTHLDSARFYKEKDIDKSLSFVEKALKNKESRQRNATSYKTLADIYLYWKQYDLAVNNYKLSIQIKENTATKIALGKAQYLLKDFIESQKTFQEINKLKLSNYERITVLEYLGDINFSFKKYNTAKTYYNQSLTLSKDNLVTPKITDLNSKLADVFAAEGNISKADIQFKNSLKLANDENINRALKEEEKVADFYNTNQRFDDEIKLRKESLLKAKKNIFHFF